jgi:hypothetical protein
MSPSEREPIAQVSDKDIVCYKALVKVSQTKRKDGSLTEPDYFITPWQWRRVSSECLEGKEDFKPDELFADVFFDTKEDEWDVGAGAIHTYADRYDAERNSKQTVFRCIIPAGTPYYVGTSDSGLKSYASAKIRFVKECEYGNGVFDNEILEKE